MPIYEYACRQCGKNFSVTMSISAHDTKKVRCPKCQGAKVIRHYSVFFAQTAKKS